MTTAEHETISRMQTRDLAGLVLEIQAEAIRLEALYHAALETRIRAEGELYRRLESVRGEDAIAIVHHAHAFIPADAKSGTHLIIVPLYLDPLPPSE